LQRFSKNFEWDRPYILDTEKNAFLNGRDVSGRHGTTWVCSKTQGFSNDLVGIWKCILLTLDALGNLFRISDNDVEWSDGHFRGKNWSDKTEDYGSMSLKWLYREDVDTALYEMEVKIHSSGYIQDILLR
jgi:hypothetical protein